MESISKRVFTANIGVRLAFLSVLNDSEMIHMALTLEGISELVNDKVFALKNCAISNVKRDGGLKFRFFRYVIYRRSLISMWKENSYHPDTKSTANFLYSHFNTKITNPKP